MLLISNDFHSVVSFLNLFCYDELGKTASVLRIMPFKEQEVSTSEEALKGSLIFTKHCYCSLFFFLYFMIFIPRSFIIILYYMHWLNGDANVTGRIMARVMWIQQSILYSPYRTEQLWPRSVIGISQHYKFFLFIADVYRKPFMYITHYFEVRSVFCVFLSSRSFAVG